MDHFTRRLGLASARRPWITITIWAVIASVAVALAGTFGGTFSDDFAAPGSRSERAIALLEERFPEAAGAGAVAVFAVPEHQRLQGRRTEVSAALERIRAIPHVRQVTDPFQAGTIAADGGIGYAEISFDLPLHELGPGPIEELGATLEPTRQAGLRAELGGDAVFVNTETPTSGVEAAGLVTALIVLVVAFGAVIAALVPIVLAVAAVGTGLAGITLLAGVLEVSTAAPTIGAMIGLGAGIDYALFITERYRQNRAAGPSQAPADALADAMGSAGSAVMFAGGTVMVAMAALGLTGVGFLTSVGLSTSLVVLCTVAASLTLLPALITLLGARIDRGRKPAPRGTLWQRQALRVSRRPWTYLLVASALLLALAAPALSMRTGFPDAGDDTTSASHRQAYDLLAEGFGPGVNGPLLLVADLREPGVTAANLPVLARDVAAVPGVASVEPPHLAADTAVLKVVTTTGPSDPATSATLERIRDLVPGNVAVSGFTALTDDLTRQLSDSLPVFVAAILAASFLLLMLVFRSVVVPLKAVVLNLLSIGGAYGVVVAVFQWGWLKELFGLEQTVTIASPLPTIFFAVLFGLSMDYEVFLLSRIREEHDAGAAPAESVARGLAATGRVITCAALIMTAVFLAFVANPSPLVRMMGLGLATAIALDATVVRMLLVPAAMTLLGPANWWFPRPLDRLPRLGARTTGRRIPQAPSAHHATSERT